MTESSHLSAHMYGHKFTVDIDLRMEYLWLIQYVKKWSQMLYTWFHFVDSQVSDEASVIYYVSMKPDLRTEWKVETNLRLIGFKNWWQRLRLLLVKSRELQVSFPFRSANFLSYVPSSSPRFVITIVLNNTFFFYVGANRITQCSIMHDRYRAKQSHTEI